MAEIRLAVPPEIDRYLDALVRTGPFGTKAELVRAAIVAYAQQAGPMAQDFDKVNHFSPDGRIYQIEYARESSRRGLPIAGAVFDKGVVLGAAYSAGPNPTVRSGGKIDRLSPHVAVLKVGLVADGRSVVRHLRRQSWKSADELVDEASRYFWEHTLKREDRPLGCSLLIASTLAHEPRLFAVDPSGSIGEMEAEVIGMGADGLREAALKGYHRGKAKDAEGLVARLLGKEGGREVVRLEV
ncbi:MAG: hypothetical protein KGJ23_03160 [Euryarchaeota archaeon]|nr:hypothetical protein [Euryarchaeota archaeon]MDE1835597.1 hypothetical protein [Euryarchaeota archaeon]MDE1878945.1 hypothetical protein [Euryarchaeota archaeon]MDE2043781.1 hypothetical protein [Thermoplasmata archaeon]